jgi:hypothetical protein
MSNWINARRNVLESLAMSVLTWLAATLLLTVVAVQAVNA